MKTQVAIVGAGPAGLMLSHLLHLNGIESVVIDTRTRTDIESTIRAGILEQNTVDLMNDTGLGERLTREGAVHHGIELRFGGEGHRIDLSGLAGGRAVTLYPQHEVLKDLVAKRLEDGGQIVFAASDVKINDVEGDPSVQYTTESGEETVHCDFVVGCDGSRGISRQLFPGSTRSDYSHQYPFAWFGILAEAPPSSEELIYARHERGFALVSSRTPTVQRLYIQVDPTDTVDDWSDQQIWDELHTRVDGNGAEIVDGKIFSKAVLTFKSYVCEPMQHGRLFLAGDSAHTVPPTGAKGMNLAIADVYLLAQAMDSYFGTRSMDLLDAYSATALKRVWRTQHFSYWMSSMLHRLPDADGFQVARQLAELEAVTASEAGRALIAENYVGFPLT